MTQEEMFPITEDALRFLLNDTMSKVKARLEYPNGVYTPSSNQEISTLIHNTFIDITSRHLPFKKGSTNKEPDLINEENSIQIEVKVSSGFEVTGNYVSSREGWYIIIFWNPETATPRKLCYGRLLRSDWQAQGNRSKSNFSKLKRESLDRLTAIDF